MFTKAYDHSLDIEVKLDRAAELLQQVVELVADGVEQHGSRSVMLGDLQRARRLADECRLLERAARRAGSCDS